MQRPWVQSLSLEKKKKKKKTYYFEHWHTYLLQYMCDILCGVYAEG